MNAFVAGAMPRTLLMELTVLPRPSQLNLRGKRNGGKKGRIGEKEGRKGSLEETPRK